MKWKLEQEEYYYKIYDSQNELAGYFQPDYGKIYPAEKEEEIIQGMITRHENIFGGMLYVPMLKLNMVNEEDHDLADIMQHLDAALTRAKRWKECINEVPPVIFARVKKSHTDPDMLSVLLGIKFVGPVKLNKDDILNALQPVLDHFHEKELL